MKKFLTLMALIPVVAYAKDVKEDPKVYYYEKQYTEMCDFVDERYFSYMGMTWNIFPEKLDENARSMYWINFGKSMAYSEIKFQIDKNAGKYSSSPATQK